MEAFGGRVLFQPAPLFPLYAAEDDRWSPITRSTIPVLFSQPSPKSQRAQIELNVIPVIPVLVRRPLLGGEQGEPSSPTPDYRPSARLRGWPAAP